MSFIYQPVNLSAASIQGILPSSKGGTGVANAFAAGILNVANGGTGVASLTLNNAILGNGTSPVQFVAPSTSGNLLTSNGTTWASSPAAAGGVSWTAVSTGITATAGAYYLVNTSGGAFTITLPLAPAANAAVYFQDAAGTWDRFNLTIGRNGQTIQGLSENLVVSFANSGFGLIYNGTDWRIW